MNYNETDIVYVIPARSGSKGVVDKNIRKLGTRSLIEIAIDCILKHKPNASIILNSDSRNYLKRTERNIVKYLRPSELAQDDTLMCDVLNQMEGNCSEYTNHSVVSIVQATCPFRKSSHFQLAEDEFFCGKHKSLTSVTQVSDMHPARMYYSSKGTLNALSSEFESINRQNLPAVFHRNGLIYMTTKDILQSGRILSESPGFIEIPRQHCINIDDEFDWQIADALFIK